VVPMAPSGSAPNGAAPVVKVVRPYDMASGRVQLHPELYDRYVSEHQESKAYIAKYRPTLCDNRNIANFTMTHKDAIHPVVCAKAEGPYVWDKDGNKVIDMGGGFGPVLFGHNPPFVREAVTDMMMQGTWGLGFEHDVVGECSDKAAKILGMDRCTWVSTGTEGTTLCMRLVRVKTGRAKIVIFENSYHGHFDGFLGAPSQPSAPDKCLPVSPGLHKGAVEELVVLKYDDEASLRWISEHADKIAGVFCESVQNRNPDVHPVNFLRILRDICDDNGIGLVFDEIVTGFRVGAGGAQKQLGISADLCSYGKALGGGFPVGLVAGRAEWMKGVDGGVWEYGDKSFPKATRTYFAGTFCKHPLIMASVNAVLDHILAHGDTFYEELNSNAAHLVDSSNRYWDEQNVAFHLAHFGSQVRFFVPPDLGLSFFHGLKLNGVYCWEGRTCFITTAHTREVVSTMIDAVKATTEQMVAAGASLPKRRE